MKSNQQFSDIINLIEQKRKIMFEANPFFKTLVNDALSVEQRMHFVPYMLFFSCGGPDVITLLMQSEKESHHLSSIEKKINAFINEDNFHYNFLSARFGNDGLYHQKIRFSQCGHSSCFL